MTTNVASFDSDITIDISLAAPALDGADFTTPLIAGSTMGVGFTDLFREYRTAAQAQADDDLSAALKAMVAQAFTQRTTPRRVLVGKIAKVAAVWQLSGLASGTTGNTIVVTILGETATFTSADGTETAEAIVDDLKSTIDGLGLDVTTTDNGTTLDIESDVPGVDLAISVEVTGSATATATETTDEVSLTEELTDLKDGADWYFLILESQTTLDIIEAAAWCETNKRLLIAQSAEAGILDSGVSNDVASALKTAGYQQSAVLYCATATDYKALAWAANRAAFDPENRSAPWNKVGLVGLDADTITPTQKTTAQGKNANLHLAFRGQQAVGDGVVASGHDIKLIITANWLQAEMERALGQLLYDRTQQGLGIEYTNDGLNVVETAAAQVLATAEAAGHIQEGWRVEMPDVEGLSANVIDSGHVTFDWYAEPVKAINAITGSGMLFRGAVALADIAA